jgi:hypothetical protein
MPSPYTSALSGLWDASDVNTWGQGLGVYPQTAADEVTVAAGHTVTYNKVSTVEMGLITLNGLLTFLNTMSTKLTWGHVDIQVNNGGEFRMGALGAIIPKAYTAEAVCNPTADGVKGINIAAGGKWTAYGDPDYFGSDFDTVLVLQAVIPAAGNAITITVPGDFTTKWAAGQELLVHKGGTYASATNDFCRLAITSLAVNGANTDIACTVTERPAVLTCAIGADVLHLTRNVRLYKLGYNANLYQKNTLRPRFVNSSVAGSTNVNMSGVEIAGFYACLTGNSLYFSGVCRNTDYGTSPTLSLSTINGILFSCYYGSSGNLNNINAHIVNCNFAGLDGSGNLFTGNIFGNTNGKGRGIKDIISGNIYANGIGYLAGTDNLFTGNLGYNSAGLPMANTIDLDYSPKVLGKAGTFLNTKSSAPPTSQNRNNLLYRGQFRFEHYQQIANAHYIADAFGDITKTAADGTGDNPTQRSGGSADVIEVVSQSNCGVVSYLELLNIRLWAAAGVSKTFRFYVQTDFATLPTAEIKLYGEYMDNNPAGTGHLAAAVTSTQDITTRVNSSDWSQYVEVTINPSVTGYINLYLRLMGYETGKKMWVDPMVAITGGDMVTVTPRWSCGEVQLDIDLVSGGLLTHSGMKGGLNG